MFHSLRPVVSASRRFCALPFVPLMASLALSLLLVPPDYAQSGPPGYYSSPAITGGQATAQGNPAPYSTNPGTGYYGVNVNGTGLSCGGQIETKWTWTPRVAGASPPQQVIVKQFSSDRQAVLK